MMFIPLGTDAPIYHFPWCTIGLIVVNCLVLLATFGMFPTEAAFDQFHFLTLEFDTINPLQWLTNNFMHANIIHLVGNMFFLWGFGLIVEGKLGWKRFLPLYLGMGMVYGAMIQLFMFLAFGSEGCALGASAVIFALLGIAVLWAPKNDLNCFMWAGIFSRMVDLPVIVFGGIYIALQFVFLILYGFHMSSEMLHLAGLAVGIPVGILFLRKDLVDCEGWDYFTVYFADASQRKSRQSEHRRNRSAEKTAEVRNEKKERIAQLDKSLTEALEAGNDRVACAMFNKFAVEYRQGERLPDASALKLVSALQRSEQWETSIPVMVRLLFKYPPEKTIGIRLNLAKLLITKTDQPKQGIAVLKKLPSAQLPDKHRAVVSKLVKIAKQKQAEGSVEFDIHDW